MSTPTTPPVFFRRPDLRARGWTDRDLGAAVADGRLLRPRPGAYLTADASTDVIDALALGGRLTCVSALAHRGVFALDTSVLHVHLHTRRTSARTTARVVRRHWGTLRRVPHPRAASVEPLDALACALRCQPPRSALASLDSALHGGHLRMDELDELFRLLPRRHRVLRRLIDARAESGPETLVRLLLRSLGAAFDVQVFIAGVGRVDFLVEGWLIVECDSREFHSDWDAQRRDRRRDQAAAALGYTTFRPIAEDIIWHPDVVRSALRGLLDSRRGPAARPRRPAV
ncbi:type IV toxin-antitoxin system AbiEi family antitoxin domain-containing protein [Microbacterium sp. NPDC077184]|uniref:type IV toxin-antitoxin system AbiEi family antitoxin domain-containing protein n=1 Tax=Microbacterium sp. NPDC077184 TaxID=3154764 RepID=UPI00341E7BED